MYKIVDHTKAKAGYLTMEFNGRRVCDFFPFARGEDSEWVRAEARRIVNVMNMIGDAAEMPPIGDARPVNG